MTRSPMTHELKTVAPFFWELKAGRKTFEVRKADRPFRVGDVLRLREWNPTAPGFTGDQIDVTVSYILAGEEWGICAGFCVMGLKP